MTEKLTKRQLQSIQRHMATKGQREELIQGIERIDAAVRVQILAPATLKTGQEFEVTVEATGGGGPGVGLALVHSAQRWQARPAPSPGRLRRAAKT